MTDGIAYIEDLINQGRYFEARAKAALLLPDSESLRTKQLYALSMSKCGLPEAAMEYLESVYNQFPDDPETAGILGGIYKELFIKTKNQHYAVLSRDTYLKNFTSTKSYYTGINAASISVISGQSKQGQRIASEVIQLLEGSSNNFWVTATLAEAFLISKERTKSKEYYLMARDLAFTDWGKIGSVYNQLWLLNHYMSVPDELLKIFKPPVIAAFVGHMIDAPGRRESRFPASIESKVKEALIRTVTSQNIKIGYCSLACGGDILFAEAIEETGGEVNIFLPFAEADFLEVSVRFAGDQWVERFDRLIKKFPVSFVTTDPYAGYDDLFFLQSGILFGSAVLRSAATHNKPHLLTVLSGRDLERKEGGTRDTLMLWPYPDNIFKIDPDNFNVLPQSIVSPSKSPDHGRNKNRPVSYILAADLPNAVPSESEAFWKAIQRKIETESSLPVGLVLSSESILAAYNSLSGVIELCHILLNAVNFYKKDNIRISLHTGPVTLAADGEVIGKKVEGSSVKILQQLRQNSAPGGIYASSHISSELALEIDKYSIDYVGKFLPEGQLQVQEIFKIGFVKGA
ncbi:adenylate/guanylate cyclase domain-containing protein [soil metagenome]